MSRTRPAQNGQPPIAATAVTAWFQRFNPTVLAPPQRTNAGTGFWGPFAGNIEVQQHPLPHLCSQTVNLDHSFATVRQNRPYAQLDRL